MCEYFFHRYVDAGEHEYVACVACGSEVPTQCNEEGVYQCEVCIHTPSGNASGFPGSYPDRNVLRQVAASTNFILKELGRFRDSEVRVLDGRKVVGIGL